MTVDDSGILSNALISKIRNKSTTLTSEKAAAVACSALMVSGAEQAVTIVEDGSTITRDSILDRTDEIFWKMDRRRSSSSEERRSTQAHSPGVLGFLRAGCRT